MRVFVTGATGYIGSAVVRELINAGHKVVGLTRSDSGAARLKEAGAGVHHGALDDLDSLQRGAAAADGVIHLAFKHDFSDVAGSLATDLRVVETIGAALKGSGKPFVTTAHANGEASDNVAIELAKHRVRASIVSLAPSVHGEGDKGFVPRLINIARDKGVSAYIGGGSNRWTAVHRLDAAHLFRLALERAPAGSRLDGVADEGVPFRDIASVIGKHLNLPVVSISREEADAYFGFLGSIAALDIPRSSVQTQELLGWHPVHPGLMADVEQGYYFNS
ncbi:SDR family oxidoreductase [Alicyclobacillus mengziensis]|uniref:SDR family oxidoreductase n=1 Tax=Alicyclobacillus mengziensis TaxID=2931921 RepID=A0A9X7VUY9_9BACL|nr:SDR family oxidoreductase [Alicyclobacillus mengziensis]QSO45636.1 SDR family oxidoreductase [Alicyclobacillus mengziensis]